MPQLSRQQGKFLAALYNNLRRGRKDVDPQFLKGWLIAENPAGAERTPQHGNQNWLNIGNTDTRFYNQGRAFSNPGQAGKNTARWLTGQWSMPGFGRAAPSIQNAFRQALGGSRQEAIDAFQASGWASSGYPNLESIVAGAGKPGYLKFLKGKQAPRSNESEIERAARGAIRSNVDFTPTSPSQGPRLSELFTTLSNLDSGYDNPYAPQGMDNWDFFAELARINEETTDSLNDMTEAIQAQNSRLGSIRAPRQGGRERGRIPPRALRGGYSGTESITKQLVDPIAAEFGIKSSNYKRTPQDNAAVGGSSTSHHLTTNKRSYAADYPTTDGAELARRIAKRMGIRNYKPGNYAVYPVKLGGQNFRVQILWAVEDHYDHVHWGIEAV